MTRPTSLLPKSFLALILSGIALFGLALLPWVASAQQRGLELDIVGGNAAATPIAVVPMPYQGTTGAPQTDIAEVVRADLARSGQFRPCLLYTSRCV